MSATLERRRRRLRRAALLGGTVAAFAALPANPAQAAFTLPACGGSAVQGEGSSLQSTAQANWRLGFVGVCTGFPLQPITYNGTGSGTGRRVLGERTGANADGSQSRNQTSRFGGTDDPLTSTGRTQIEQGTNQVGDEGKIHEIPVGAAAIAVIVNFPDACNLSSVPAGNQSDAGQNDNRVQFTKAQLEAIFNGGTDADTWGKVLSGITPTGPTCADLPIKRVVRQDDSGSTFVLKSFLGTINAGRGWTTTYLAPDTTNWPNNSSLVIPAAKGGGALADAVNANDGSIGYVDLATARTKNFSLDTSAPAPGDTSYWIKVPNGSGTFTDPAADPASFKSIASPVKGANCSQVVYANVPSTPSDPTFGDWAPTSGVNALNGYGLCTLTYDLAFDDNSTAYGGGSSEEAKARTIKDYLTYIVSDAGQAKLQPNDYTELPASILGLARAGVAAISWNKAGDPPPGCTSNCPPPVCTVNCHPGGGGGGGGGNHPPSNVFSISSVSVSKTGKVTFSLQVPGAGVLTLTSTGKPSKGKAISSAGSSRATASAGGVVSLSFSPSSKVKSALKKHLKVKLTVKIVFTPTGGNASAPTTRTLTLKPAKKH